MAPFTECYFEAFIENILLCFPMFSSIHFLLHHTPLTEFVFFSATQVDGDEETPSAPTPETSRGKHISINLHPTNAYEFGQALNAARISGNTAACAELLASTPPQNLPQYLSTQLDGLTIGFMMQAMDSHLLRRNPGLVYRHLCHLHTADRFKVSLH